MPLESCDMFSTVGIELCEVLNLRTKCTSTVNGNSQQVSIYSNIFAIRFHPFGLVDTLFETIELNRNQPLVIITEIRMLQ